MSELEIKKIRPGLSSAALHIIAMALMLCDHLWATIFPYLDVLTCIGRIAFPIFAFMIAEGYRHTSNVKKYMLRMLIFAVLAEIPFNLVYGGQVSYIYHQNVLWTFLIALVCMTLIDKVKAKGRTWLTIFAGFGIVFLGALIGTIGMVDYYGAGVLTVLTFYFFREKKWWCFAGQLICMYYINVEMLGGYYYPVTIAGHYFELQQQGLALIALIPIWLYNGTRGYNAKWFKYFCYAFYPVHFAVLYVIWQYIM